MQRRHREATVFDQDLPICAFAKPTNTFPMKTTHLSGDIRINHVRLRVRDLASELDFYRRVLGLPVLAEHGAELSFAAPGQREPLLVLVEDRAAPVHRHPMAGIFHIAFRYPTRRALADAIHRLVVHRYAIEGASHHLVSEAIYLSDPEGNGIELYRDLPRDQWKWRGDEVVMATEALDLRSLLAASESDTPSAEVPPGTDVGHMHLQVTDLAVARRFFHEFLGLDITSQGYPGALFFSAGRYHHHIGTNVWGRKTVLPDEDTTGLAGYRMEVSGVEVLEALRKRAQSFNFETKSGESGDEHNAFQVRDPSGAWLEIGVKAD